ncbi:MAG: type II secretion system-associated lipoprotein [Leptospiraceae bacterium]|nr:type II secretion system-associated lipoprotein [Leptospiraceae bacterium]
MTAMFRPGSLQSLILSIALLGTLAQCSAPVIRAKDAEEWNTELKTRVFRTRKDIFPGFANQADQKEPLFKAGTLVKLRIESTPDWVKIRARRADSDQENTPGNVILYVFREDLESESSRGRPMIEEKLNQLVSPAN